VNLDIQIVLIDMGPEFEFLDLACPLVLLHGVELFALLVLELSKVHELADRGLCIGRDLDEIISRFFGLFDRNIGRDDANLFPVGTNQSDFFGFDLIIDARFLVNQNPP
jgi:hypothetical protein